MFVFLCKFNFHGVLKLLPGASPSFKPGYGSEDEQDQQQQSQYAEGSPTDEPASPPKYTQVCRSSFKSLNGG